MMQGNEFEKRVEFFVSQAYAKLIKVYKNFSLCDACREYCSTGDNDFWWHLTASHGFSKSYVRKVFEAINDSKKN